MKRLIRDLFAVNKPGSDGSQHGAASSLAAQLPALLVCQQSATGNGAGAIAQVEGFNGAQMVEVVEDGGGTCTLTLQGSNNGTTWYALGYQQVDNIAAPVRSVSTISVSGSTAHVYQALDAYRFVQAVISSKSGNLILTVRVYALPA